MIPASPELWMKGAEPVAMPSTALFLNCGSRQRCGAKGGANMAPCASVARFGATVQRKRLLLQRLTLHVAPAENLIDAFLGPPLYSIAFSQGFGTLYTAVYRPGLGQMELRWPRATWPLSIHDFVEGQRTIHTPEPARSFG